MKRIILAVALSALIIPAYADNAVSADGNTSFSSHRDITANGKLSTLGLGVELAFPLTQSVDARIGLNAFNISVTKSTTPSPGSFATNYTGTIKLQSIPILADWHPWQNSFRITGGLVYNNNKFDFSAVPAAGNFIYLNGNKYNISNLGGSAFATVDFNKVAPYLGIGWGRTPKNTGLSFTSDFGILFQGTPNSNITTNGITSVVGSDPTKDKALATAQLQDSVKNYNLYPVVSIGIGYSF